MFYHRVARLEGLGAGVPVNERLSHRFKNPAARFDMILSAPPFGFSFLTVMLSHASHALTLVIKTFREGRELVTLRDVSCPNLTQYHPYLSPPSELSPHV